jgi:uncharacterized protein YndB with AHSA1/START domain
MSDIAVVVDRTFASSPEVTFAALADYAKTRAEILPPEITDFTVLDGGTGAGTRFRYDLHATKKRIRHVEATVTEPEAGRQLLEADGNSTLKVQWNVAESAGGGSTVTVQVGWQGAGGIGGFFERRFAPAGIKRIYGDELNRLEAALA